MKLNLHLVVAHPEVLVRDEDGGTTPAKVFVELARSEQEALGRALGVQPDLPRGYKVELFQLEPLEINLTWELVRQALRAFWKLSGLVRPRGLKVGKAPVEVTKP